VSASHPSPGPLRLVKASPEDAGELSSIARASKAHWGYPAAWIGRWDHALTVTPEYIRAHPTHAVAAAARLVGFFTLVVRGNDAFLEHFWVLPAEMGRGVGRLMFEAAETFAREAGASCLKVESDPHAEGFYVRMGAVACGRVPAQMDGNERYLPLLEKAL
jgi:GNAT superfamily N-acetyltransferase